MAIYQAWTDRDTYRCGKLARVLEPNAKSCEITKLTSDPIHRVLLVGDSHADSVKKTFRSVAESKNISVRFIVENAPLRGSGMTPESLVQEAELRKAQHIVMHYSPGGIEVAKVQQVVELADQKHIAVSFIMPVPTWNEHIPMALWKNLKEHTPLPQMTIDSYLQKNSLFDGALSNIRIGSFTAYRVVDSFCQTACQIVEISGKPLYFDDSHLTVTGSERLRGVFEIIVGRRMDLLRSPNGTP